MLKQLTPIDLIKAIQANVQTNTSKKCYDVVPTDAPSPFFYVEFLDSEPVNSKTMYKGKYRVWIHVIAEPCDSSIPVYNYIQELEESMTEDIELPEDYELILQTNNGIKTIKTDETNEKHAVIEYEFMICYGFKCKI